MVAPTTTALRAELPDIFQKMVPGDIGDTITRAVACPAMGCDFRLCLREQVLAADYTSATADQFLSQRDKSLRRCNSAFVLFFKLGCELGCPFPGIGKTQVVSVLSMLFQHSMSQARSAYAAILMFSSMSSLRFDPAIRAMKQQWNASSPQYAAFWCGTTVLRSLISQTVNFRCGIQVRNRLIIVWRLLHLYHSVDLAHLRRLWAKGPNGELYIAAQRKGWLSWERVMVLPNRPTVCPLHLIIRYMHITPEGTPRGPLLLALVKPHRALSSDRVGALTKQILHTNGVDVTHYKPHTTRGAGKLIHKQMNWPPDISCEIGLWANYEAYCKHYNRLGAVDTAATALNAHLAVHTTPSPSCAAEAPLHTLLSEQAGGRSKGNKAALCCLCSFPRLVH